MGNGLIVAFLVVVWAAYFVPLVLRRYDEAGKPTTIRRLSSLSRKVARPAADTAGSAPQEESTDYGADIDAHGGPALSGTVQPEARQAARRRRRVLTVLAFITAAALSIAAIGLMSWWVVTLPLMADAAWLVACRVQVRNGSVTRIPQAGPHRSVSAAGEERGSDAFDAEQTVEVSGFFADPDPERGHEMHVDGTLPDDALDERLEIAVPVGSSASGALWDPLPVTVPTYVTKPRAGRTVRTIDFGEPGTWTSGHVEGEDVELPRRRDESESARDVG